MRLALILALLSAAAFAQIDAPQPQPKPQKAGFFTFRSWEDPPLRSNKQTLRSPYFWIVNALPFAVAAYDIHHTHGAREQWHSEGPVLGAMVGFNYVFDRFVSRSYTLGFPAYAVVHYARDAARGR